MSRSPRGSEQTEGQFEFQHRADNSKTARMSTSSGSSPAASARARQAAAAARGTSRRPSFDFPTRPVGPSPTGDSGISRFPRMVCPSVHGISDHAGAGYVSRWRRTQCSLPPLLTASAPRRKGLSRLNTRPAGLPLLIFDASAASLRTTPHDSGRCWVANPSPYDSFIHNTMPVYPGAQGTGLITSRVRITASSGRAIIYTRVSTDEESRSAVGVNPLSRPVRKLGR
jgi:hypothetical protein